MCSASPWCTHIGPIVKWSIHRRSLLGGTLLTLSVFGFKKVVKRGGEVRSLIPDLAAQPPSSTSKWMDWGRGAVVVGVTFGCPRVGCTHCVREVRHHARCRWITENVRGYGSGPCRLCHPGRCNSFAARRLPLCCHHSGAGLIAVLFATSYHLSSSHRSISRGLRRV
ncbi:hypothetical protein BC826DRAFT_234297 [Russula brevipes]|nr:hypothetical protein BC826DRAFT_234297 [Russula brevipes]